MLHAVALATASLMAIPPRRASDYVLTQRDVAMVRAAFKSQRFPTASEAAYAASLNYGRAVLTTEVGAKIYVDLVQNALVYSYGSPVYGQTDEETGDQEIVYDPMATDGHLLAVGFWHQHPSNEGFLTLYGHYAEVQMTHQTVWTTIGRNLFAQFWDGSRPMPDWTSAVPAIEPIARF